MIVRKYTKEDREGAESLLKAFNEKDIGMPTSTIKEANNPILWDIAGESSFVLEVKEQVVGIMAGIYKDDLYCEMIFFILPKYSRLCGFMIKGIERILKDEGVKEMIIAACRSSKQDKAIELFEACGFKQYSILYNKELV